MTIKIDRVFENFDFIVVDKPGGVLTTPSRMGEKDSRPVLGLLLQHELGQQIFPVHRLDFEVSGLVMFAKNASAHKKSNQWFEKRMIHKTYEALTLSKQNFSHIPDNLNIARHSFHPQVGENYEWKCLLLRGKRRAYENAKGDLSVTKAQLLGEFVSGQNKFWQWNLQPVTGRSHQLRYEMSRHGFSILGDELYGSKDSWQYESIALRAVQIDLSEISLIDRMGLPEKISAKGF